MMQVHVPISVGELLDKISILEIKREQITDAAKRVNVERELTALERAWKATAPSSFDVTRLRDALKRANAELWRIEDEIRRKELRAEFDQQFVGLARAVYFTNDERARLKREINRVLDSAFVEEKQHVDYHSRRETHPAA